MNTQLIKELIVDATTYNQALISLTYTLINQIIELLNNKFQIIDKWTQDTNMKFTNETIHRTNKHMERYSTSLESTKIA